MATENKKENSETEKRGSGDVDARPAKKGFFATFSNRSLTERFLIIFFFTLSALALLTLVLVCLSINNVFPEGMNVHDDGGGEMNWYGYIIAVAIILCIVPGIFTALKQGYYQDLVFDYIIFAVPCAFAGAVLYYGATNHGDFGGLAVIGGLFGAAIGIVLAMVFWQKVLHHPRVTVPQLLDIAAPFVLLGQCVGRFACYYGHCCYGIEVDFNFFPYPSGTG